MLKTDFVTPKERLKLSETAIDKIIKLVFWIPFLSFLLIVVLNFT